MGILMIVLFPAIFLHCVKLYNMDICTLAVFFDSMIVFFTV